MPGASASDSFALRCSANFTTSRMTIVGSVVGSTAATSIAFGPLRAIIVLESFPSLATYSGGALRSAVFVAVAAPSTAALRMANVSANAPAGPSAKRAEPSRETSAVAIAERRVLISVSTAVELPAAIIGVAPETVGLPFRDSGLSVRARIADRHLAP